MKLITQKEAALRLGVSRPTLAAWIHRADDPLPAVAIGSGRVLRVIESEIDPWIARESQRVRAAVR